MHSINTRILVVDDDKNLSQILVNILDYEGYRCEYVNTGHAAIEKGTNEDFDLVLLDLALPDINGMDVLKAIFKIKPALPVIMISGQGSINKAIEATHLGAYSFLEKPLDTERIIVTVKNALEKGQLLRKTNWLREDVKDKFSMIGNSTGIEKVRQLILRAAATDSKVLIEGENGTGKELVARGIYFNSRRFGEPFIAVNCAAIPENLVESELFGYKRGAFTGAFADKTGRFQAANKGTIFLDEIGDMSLMTQAKVLRVLENNSIEMIGSNKEIHIDVRIVAATNRNLQDELDKNNFREDLYYRLNVINIHLPPLRERRDDIPMLVNHFIRYFCEEQGRVVKEITNNGMERLTDHNWPGNVRELRNIIEKLIALYDTQVIQQKDIVALLGNDSLRQNAVVGDYSFKEARNNFEKKYILAKLTECDWNITQTAELLQIPRTYLYKKMNLLNIDY